MAKVVRENTQDYKLLYDALLSLKTRKECKAFLEDICTIKEIDSLAQRLDVAVMLQDEKTYLEIAEGTGASTATISRVNRALHYGSDGYNTVLKRITGKKKQNKGSKK